MRQFGMILFWASAAPIGLYLGHVTLPEQAARPTPIEDALNTYVLEPQTYMGKWMSYVQSCHAQGGTWDHAQQCCHMPKLPVPSHDADDQNDEPIATK